MYKNYPHISFGDKCIIAGTFLAIFVICFTIMQRS